jgi:hypothetical protein
MSGTVYSYKPASGVLTEGASTVVTLRTGELLELRRGEKTRWAVDEARHKWATLEEWKATLPADAEIKVRAAAAADAIGSADFERVRAMLIEHKCRPYMRMWAQTNATDASEYRRCAEEIHQHVEWIVCRNNGDVSIMNRWDRDWLSKQYAKAADYRVRAEALAKEPYTRYFSHGYKSLGTCRLLARRTSDGMFIPLFLDLERGLFHTPAEFGKPMSRVGATLTDLGVDPVFLLHSSTVPGALRQVTL